MNDSLLECAAHLVAALRERGKTLALAESCTGGMVASAIASIPGASKVLWGSFVTYTVDAKCAMLGIDRALIEKHGAVSEETAIALVTGALEKSGADYAVSVTGLAGPDGDGSATPVGTVWIGCASRGQQATAHVHHFSGDRDAVRTQAADTVAHAALTLMSNVW